MSELIQKMNAITKVNLCDPMVVNMDDWNSVIDEVRQVLEQLEQAQEKLENYEALKRMHRLESYPNELAARGWLLRKQAEAIVKAAEANGLAGGRSHYALCSDLICDAKEMFEQADELERVGGDNE